ncbi:helix-turn-helix domain-containing protein [Endozoicomonas gorgoniicola]|uniref:Helix-turn-helix domain-containing protein n=1 Tax=Endozoicomonas gorgoniicola TaxID=1234144 RepID=A0ABT3MNW8_9GAMM|nr:helix-turn-helix domain-containing protein [Endozoicomonas gorgoniicola]MCW7551078.1 helix-turn-helix domain-containing protein [Endozoicomonas gorgoniicola]MCW7556470.1 helix-turn-helix domain-containing protein [Endozoicomonas gorgoniicola]
MNYHYTECGLSYIYLEDGYEVENIDGDTYVGIEDVDGLHRVIAKNVTEKKSTLEGQEIRFLRVEMGMSQKHLAEILGVDTQTVARWEKDQTVIPRTSDAVLRTLYLESVDTSSNVSFFLRLLAENEETAAIEQLILKAENHHWSVAI